MNSQPNQQFFDGRQALKSKLCLNLRNCQYELFRNIALNELGWRVVDGTNRVIEAGDDQENIKQNSQEEEIEEQDSNGEQDEINSQQHREELPEDDSTVDNSNKEGQQKQSQLNQVCKFRYRPDIDPNNWDIFWADSGMTPEFQSSLAPTQRVNHFLGMYNLCRKSTLGMHLKRFQKEYPEYYDFFPQTWVYPAEFHDIQEYTKKKMEKRKEKIEDGLIKEANAENDPVVLYICKPESGSQGRGIFIAQSVEQMRIQLNKQQEKNRENMNEYIKVETGLEIMQAYSNQSNQKKKEEIEKRQIEKPQNQYIVQKYLKKPALYQGHKYDFRIYVYITSVISPMSVFLYNDGLVRLASQKYDKNKDTDDAFVHLTNYSLNKNNKDFDSELHKLKLKDVLKGELINISMFNNKTYRKHSEQIWAEIEAIVIKTIFVVQPQLQHLYRTSQAKEPDLCCDLLGFDVMLDHKLKPWILEVNHMPSFRADTQVDYDVKHDLVLDTLRILQLSIESRRQLDFVLKQEQKQATQYGNVRRLTVKEHCDRVRFDHNLVEKFLPGSNFKRIYPLDPGAGGVDKNGEALEEIYIKLEKSAQTLWKKQFGMVQKKEINPNIHDQQAKKKKKKNKKNLLTSMTTHIPADKKNANNEFQDLFDQEEPPEDGLEEEEMPIVQEDAEGNSGLNSNKDHNSTVQLNENKKAQDAVDGQSSDLRHIVSNSTNYRRNQQYVIGGRMNQMQNQSQSSLSKNSTCRGGQTKTAVLPGSVINKFTEAERLSILKRTDQNKIHDDLKNIQNQVQVPTLNEILTQLHQDPGFRQRYKEYCRAVLDGRFSFGGIKNPIYDHLTGANTQPAMNQNQMQGHLKYANIPLNTAQSINGGVTLLSNNARHQGQIKIEPVASQVPSKRGKLDSIPHIQKNFVNSNAGPTISEAAYFIQRVNRILQNQSDTFQNGAQGPVPVAANGNLQRLPNSQANANYQHIQNVNNGPQQNYTFNFVGNHANLPNGHNNSVNSQSQMSKYNQQILGQYLGPPESHSVVNPSQSVSEHTPYLGLAIQSVSAAPNFQNSKLQESSQGGANAEQNPIDQLSCKGSVSQKPQVYQGVQPITSYANAIKQMQMQNQQTAVNIQNNLISNQGMRGNILAIQNPQLNFRHQAVSQSGATMNGTGNNFNIYVQKQARQQKFQSQNSQNTQKAIIKIQSLQNSNNSNRQSHLNSQNGKNSQVSQQSQVSQGNQQQLAGPYSRSISGDQNDLKNFNAPDGSTLKQQSGMAQVNLLKAPIQGNKTLPSHQAKKLGIPLTFQQQQILNNLQMNSVAKPNSGGQNISNNLISVQQQNSNQFTHRGPFNNSSNNIASKIKQDQNHLNTQADQLPPFLNESSLHQSTSNGIVLTNQLYKKQPISFQQSQQNTTKLFNNSQAVPAINKQQQKYESVKKYMQASKGIGGVNNVITSAGGEALGISQTSSNIIQAPEPVNYSDQAQYLPSHNRQNLLAGKAGVLSSNNYGGGINEYFPQQKNGGYQGMSPSFKNKQIGSIKNGPIKTLGMSINSLNNFKEISGVISAGPGPIQNNQVSSFVTDSLFCKASPGQNKGSIFKSH